MVDQKTSLLVNRQLPEFIRDEYPKFISFLEAYYEFLENEQLTGGITQKNDLIAKSKDLRYVSDVDYSLDAFEKHFFDMFLPYMPKDVAANKEFFIKNIMPVYLAKGSEKSYQLLFRLLFGQEATLSYPRDQILRASDGRWTKESVLKITEDLYTEFVCSDYPELFTDTKSVFYLPYSIEPEDIAITVDGNPVSYRYYKEYREIIFDDVLNTNSTVRIDYQNFDSSIFTNRRVVGIKNNGHSIVERTNKRIVGEGNYFELFLNDTITVGSFGLGELLNIGVIVNGLEVSIYATTFSSLSTITIETGGAGYNIGDPVIIRGISNRDGYAIVDDVVSGLVEDILVLNGGAGFKAQNIVNAIGYDANTFNAAVSAVNSGAENILTQITLNDDIISNFSSVLISDADYGFPANTDADIDAVISTALSTTLIENFGAISSVVVNYSLISSLSSPTFEVVPETVLPNTTLYDLGVIGKIDIIDGGEGYSAGDNLVFTWATSNISGSGAEARVQTVDANGSIQTVEIVNGGLGYRKGNFPLISVENTSLGSNANLIVNCLMGDGEELLPETLTEPIGKILSIRIVDAGSGYANVPGVDLSGSGNGGAIAVATLASPFSPLEGRWTTSDSIISSEEIRLQGRDYFINYSYLISSQVEFSKYKSLLKNVIHPAGLINYSSYQLFSDVQSAEDTVLVSSDIMKTAAA
jgi:hypothetical protein